MATITVVRYIAKYGTDRVSRAVLAAAVPPFLHKSADNPAGGAALSRPPHPRVGV